MLDLDHFKQFNDTFGHEAGDHLLREFGQFLRRNSRSEDIACRYGGEEFLVVLVDVSVAQACDRAEALRVGVKGLYLEHRGQPLGPVTASIGVAAFPDHGSTIESILRLADAALYQAKKAGRDQVRISNQPPTSPERPL
jgi:diguanylate cyclase (GGDEF)-like protein